MANSFAHLVIDPLTASIMVIVTIGLKFALIGVVLDWLGLLDVL